MFERKVGEASMKRKVSWSFGVGLVGLYLAQKQTYWLPGTYLRDTLTSAAVAIGFAIVGFLLGCIATRTVNKRQRRLKVMYWLAVMGILATFLGTGKGVPVSMTLAVFAWALGIGLVVGALQYFLQRPRLPVSE
jgi:hypothetical protein